MDKRTLALINILGEFEKEYKTFSDQIRSVEQVKNAYEVALKDIAAMIGQEFEINTIKDILRDLIVANKACEEQNAKLISLEEENKKLHELNNSYAYGIREIAGAIGYDDSNIKMSVLKEKIVNIIDEKKSVKKKTSK